LQNLSVKNDSILISGGQGIKLPASATTEDDQTISFDQTTNILSLENGGTADLSSLATNSNDADADSTNELQNLSIKNDSILISGGKGIKLPASVTTEDDQAISFDQTTNILTLENGGTADLSSLATNSNDADADSTNELQTISFANDTIYLSNNGGKAKIEEKDPNWNSEKTNYYTKTNLGTVGESTIEWANLANIPATLDIDSTDNFSGNYADLSGKPTDGLSNNSVPRWNSASNAFTDGLIIDDGTNVAIGGATNSSYVFFVNGKFGSAGINELSDRRFKTDIEQYKTSLEQVCKLQAVTYKWKKEQYPERNFTDNTEIGFIAQEVEALFPELVTTDAEGYKTVQYSRTVAILLEAIKELNTIVQAQQNQITKLEANIGSTETMQTQIQQLQTQISILSNAIENANKTASH